MGFGERLKKVRGGIKQDEFAIKCGFHKNTIGKWERDEQCPKVDDLNRILTVFPDINPTWLLTGEGNMQRGTAISEGEGPELDLALMEKIVFELIKAQRSTGVEEEDLCAEALAQATASSIINTYRKCTNMPVASRDKVISSYNRLFEGLNEKLKAIADKRGV